MLLCNPMENHLLFGEIFLAKLFVEEEIIFNFRKIHE